MGLVVQPGVEFGDEGVHHYQPERARPLKELIERVPGIVYEAHSTDHQEAVALRRLVEDHFAILKVGPWLTYAFREAVFALAEIEREWLGARAGLELSQLREVVDEAMRRDPTHWRGYYRGDEERQRRARQASLSDRIRYYWARPEVAAALERLVHNLERASPIPDSLLSRHLSGARRVSREGRAGSRPRELILSHIHEVLERYVLACGASGAGPMPLR
jgi:D-tagatose-1,6-bisphosphate aldolase subunit GatZ/KbaZ